jgi:hypothetical protein
MRRASGYAEYQSRRRNQSLRQTGLLKIYLHSVCLFLLCTDGDARARDNHGSIIKTFKSTPSHDALFSSPAFYFPFIFILF